MSHLMNTYARLPVAFTHGQGAWLFDAAGNKYLDALAGIAVNGLGHAHPQLVAALRDQVGKLIHTSNVYRVTEQEQLADRLCALSGMQEVFFGNSGAEANEGALKLVRFLGHKQGESEAQTIVMEHAWHGRTLATLAATGSEKARKGFDPLPSGFIRVPYNDLPALDQVAANPNIVAVLVEPVQGESGIHIPDDGYLRQLREICDRKGWLLMLDEVQSGMARSGKWFACQHANVVPDVMTLAKGLGNGFPIGACLARGVAAQTFKPGNHGSSFGGNPLACVAALTTLSIIEDEGLVERAATLGKRMVEDFASRLAGVEGVRQIRGKGLLLGIELDRPCADLVVRGLEAGLVINVTADTVVRLLPPLNMTDAEAGQLVEGVAGLIRTFLQAKAGVAAAH